MNTTTLGRLIVALLSVGGVIALAGCSTPGAVKKACTTEANLVDATGSTAAYRGEWPAELSQVARDALRRGDTFVASTFTSGAGTVDWSVNADGCHSPESRPHKHLAWANGQAGALGPELTKLASSRMRGGSDPLGALEATAKLPHLSVVRLWTDLIIQDGGVDLSRPVSSARLARLGDEWTPRLAGLRGVHVVVLHAGRGTDSDGAIRQSEKLLRTVLDRVGATLEWQPVMQTDRG